MHPNYKGKNLKELIERYHIASINLDAGTVLINTMPYIIYFEIESSYVYSDVKRKEALKITPGSGIVRYTHTVLDKSELWVLPDFVKIPTDDELAWYERQKTI